LNQISSVVDSLVLILLAKMQFNLVFRNQVGVDRESAEGWCFVSGHDFSRAILSRKKLGFSPCVPLPNRHVASWICCGICRLQGLKPRSFATLYGPTTAFSLQVYTEQPLLTWLFLKKSRTSLNLTVLSRSENALKSCPDTKQKDATLHGQALAAPSGNRKKSNLDKTDFEW
jgi:hypothetical protein